MIDIPDYPSNTKEEMISLLENHIEEIIQERFEKEYKEQEHFRKAIDKMSPSTREMAIVVFKGTYTTAIKDYILKKGFWETH